MNYFAHGMRFLDRPYFLVGTALPDLLSVVDRNVRLRAKLVEPFAGGRSDPAGQLAAGVLQHLHDDRWFHKTRAFFEVTGELTRLFREHGTGDDRFRASFLGHIVTELLLDRVLDAEHPGGLDRYYAALEQVDGSVIEDAVNRMARQPTRRLAMFLGLFQRERFLYDYADSERLLFRLNQVMQRVKLPPLPVAALGVLDAGVVTVRQRWRDLLPAEHFVLNDAITPETSS
ncbi:MAG: hypothetical protein AB7I48_22525 [Planctomycetaceae bacterium]